MALKAKPGSEMDTSNSSAEQQSEDSKVDIMECGKLQEKEEEVVLCEEVSSSSSFGDSMCARDDADSGFGGDVDDAQSMLSKDYPLSRTCDDVSVFRKKKLTDEWRRFCQPIAWRCKWLEIKVKEIESQARGYEKEVRSYYESKEFDLEKSKVEGFDGKSIPFREHSQKMNVFKRRRRKRVEETTDVAAYMANHNLFSYADQRMPASLKPQNLDPGRKATIKEDGNEDDCLVSELDCSDDSLAKILCKIDEAQEKARSLRKRVDQLMIESQTAHTASMPQTIAPCQRDLTVQQNGKQHALLEEPLILPQTAARTQREATVQIRRQRISADHTEDLLVPQAPPVEIGGQCLNNNSPLSSGDLRYNLLVEDMLMDEPEMNGDETEMDEEKFIRFMKLMDEFRPASPEQADAEEDHTPVNKRRKT